MPVSEKERNQKVQEKYQAILTQMLRDDDNKYCVDCDAKGPRWASWNIGVFLCIRCAGIHRNLGVHISKVKSVNLDQWTAEQIASMQAMGNSKGRAVYEANLPDNYRRPQTDSPLEQFIRGKYEQRKWIAKEWIPPNITISPDLTDDEPPKEKPKSAKNDLKLNKVVKKSDEKNKEESKKSPQPKQPPPPIQPAVVKNLVDFDDEPSTPASNGSNSNNSFGPFIGSSLEISITNSPPPTQTIPPQQSIPAFEQQQQQQQVPTQQPQQQPTNVELVTDLGRPKTLGKEDILALFKAPQTTSTTLQPLPTMTMTQNTAQFNPVQQPVTGIFPTINGNAQAQQQYYMPHQQQMPPMMYANQQAHGGHMTQQQPIFNQTPSYTGAHNQQVNALQMQMNSMNLNQANATGATTTAPTNLFGWPNTTMQPATATQPAAPTTQNLFDFNNLTSHNHQPASNQSLSGLF